MAASPSGALSLVGPSPWQPSPCRSLGPRSAPSSPAGRPSPSPLSFAPAGRPSPSPVAHRRRSCADSCGFSDGVGAMPRFRSDSCALAIAVVLRAGIGARPGTNRQRRLSTERHHAGRESKRVAATPTKARTTVRTTTWITKPDKTASVAVDRSASFPPPSDRGSGISVRRRRSRHLRIGVVVSDWMSRRGRVRGIRSAGATLAQARAGSESHGRWQSLAYTTGITKRRVRRARGAGSSERRATTVRQQRGRIR